MRSKQGAATGVLAIIPWWYLDMPAVIGHHQRLLFFTIADYFSFPILLRTFFQPWKRDELSYETLALGERIQVLLLNLMSRLIGAILRAAALVAGLIVLGALVTFYVFLWTSWLLAPFLGLFLILFGLWTMLGGFR